MIFVLQVAISGPATATPISCVSALRNLFDGLYSDTVGPGGSYQGTSAVMVNNTAPICDDNTNPAQNFTYTWVMIAQNQSGAGAGTGFAQVGFFRGYGECTYWASEFNSGVQRS